MDTTQERQDPAGQVSRKSVEAMALWAEASQKVLEESVGLASAAAAEGLRLYTQLTSSTVEVARAGREFWLRRLGEVQEWQRDPAAWSQKALLDAIEESKKAFAAAEESSRAMTRSAEKLQASVEQAAEKIRRTLTDVAAEVRGLYTPPAR